MKIVVLDGHAENPGDLSWEPLAELGALTVYPRTPPELVAERIGDAGIVLVNKTELTEAVFAACPSIRCVGVLATGYNVVDTAAARRRGIDVCNVPAYGTAAVAQFTFALMLELCHHAGEHSRSARSGEWTASRDFCYWNHPQIELAGKTLGIIGFGRIGRNVARIAKAFGMTVLANGSGRREPEPEDGVRFVPPDRLLAESDFISLHCPLTDATRGLVGKENIAKMKTGVRIVNTARGALIVESDLAAALESGKVAGAAVDVLSTEPPAAENPLLRAPGCIVTPHIAWAAKESRERLMKIAVGNVRAFLAGKPVNVVNR